MVLQGETWLARHAHVVQVVAAAKGGADVSKALLLVERMLMEQDMMQPHWASYLQEPWRKGLAKCSDPRQAIMYLSSLQVSRCTDVIHFCSMISVWQIGRQNYSRHGDLLQELDSSILPCWLIYGATICACFGFSIIQGCLSLSVIWAMHLGRSDSADDIFIAVEV